MRPVILFDMDGVLCDFVSGALSAHGKSLPMRECQWNFYEQVGLTADEFWDRLTKPEFWANLPPLFDGLQLLARLQNEGMHADFGFLSSGLCPGSCDGKRQWIKRKLPHMELREIFCTRKELVAGPGKLLIDDHEPNVQRFIEHGGSAILVPRPWNSRSSETIGVDARFHVQSLFDEVVRTVRTMGA